VVKQMPPTSPFTHCEVLEVDFPLNGMYTCAQKRETSSRAVITRLDVGYSIEI